MFVTVVALFLGVGLAIKMTAAHAIAISIIVTIVAFAVGLAVKDIRPAASCPLWGWSGFTFLIGSVVGMLLR
ncbi:MAG TPA: hypothetical protein VFK07_03005 [Candidatus Paceibacterota bacterium]|nr:hypothetical protein [Candidatus Paceibacterota bacterium]